MIWEEISLDFFHCRIVKASCFKFWNIQMQMSQINSEILKSLELEIYATIVEFKAKFFTYFTLTL